MKYIFIYCPKCSSVVQIKESVETACECSSSSGWYESGKIYVRKRAIPLSFHFNEFIKAANSVEAEDKPVFFGATFLPRNPPLVIHLP